MKNIVKIFRACEYDKPLHAAADYLFSDDKILNEAKQLNKDAYVKFLDENIPLKTSPSGEKYYMVSLAAP